jgi:hypothetical protein
VISLLSVDPASYARLSVRSDERFDLLSVFHPDFPVRLHRYNLFVDIDIVSRDVAKLDPFHNDTVQSELDQF